MALAKALLVLVAFGIVFTMLSGGFTDVFTAAEEVRTAPAQEVGKSCTTAAGATSCSFTLANEHAFRKLFETGGTLTETAPGAGDRTGATALAFDRKTVTVSGLAAATAYTFTVDYLVVDSAVAGFPFLAYFLHVAPLVFLVGGIGVFLLAAGVALREAFKG